MGVVYLLHFERTTTLGTIGYTDDLEARVAAHRAGHGSCCRSG
jgi:predicted GIY-YIG superfamily endonuclease